MCTFPLDFPFCFICIFLQQQNKQLAFIKHVLRAKHGIEGFLYISWYYSFVDIILSVERDRIPNSSWFKQRKRMNYLVSVENHDWHHERLKSCPPQLVSLGSTPREQALITKQKGLQWGPPTLTTARLWKRGGSHKPEGHAIGLAWVTWPPTNQSLVRWWMHWLASAQVTCPDARPRGVKSWFREGENWFL